MIQFHCRHCNARLRRPLNRAGKTTTCPVCHEKVTIPFPRQHNSSRPVSSLDPRRLDLQSQKHPFQETGTKDATATPATHNDLYDSDIFEIPILEKRPAEDLSDNRDLPPSKTPQDVKAVYDIKQDYDPNLLAIPQIEDIPGTQAYHQAKLKEAQVQSEESSAPVPQRILPWPLDILLYPLNKGGLFTLGVIFGTPLVCSLIVGLAWFMFQILPLLIILLTIVVMATMCVLGIMILYFLWYICDCIRDSAEGHVRAPDTLGQAPGFMELIGQLFYILTCIFIYTALDAFIMVLFKPSGWIFWTTQVVLSSIFLMALLCVIVTESLGALNPLVPLIAISKIWPSFIMTVCLVGLFLAVPPALSHLTVRSGMLPANRWVLTGLMICLYPYPLLVSAHVLGYFYFKHEEKIAWDS